MWTCSSPCFPLFASPILLPFLVAGHPHTALTSLDSGLRGKGQVYLRELQIIPFGLWPSIQVVKPCKKLPVKPEVGGLKLIQTVLGAVGEPLGACYVFSFLGNMLLLWCEHRVPGTLWIGCLPVWHNRSSSLQPCSPTGHQRQTL